MTEGMSDEVVKGKYRGWADRVADVLAKEDPDFTYVNLAIRGKLLKQVVEDQIPTALKYIEGKQTLVSFHAGANDVLRPNYKPEVSLPEYERGIKQLTDSGATVIVFTVVDKVEGTITRGDLSINDIVKNGDNSELISLGSQGEGVEEIQKILDKEGYDLGEDGIDGIYGSNTMRAVKKFQRKNGLNLIDGIVGIETSTEFSKH